MRAPSTFTATLNLQSSGAYEVTYEYEAPEPDVGLSGGWVAINTTDAAGFDVDDDTIVEREIAAGNSEFTLDMLTDRFAEVATANEPSYDGPDEPDFCDDEVGFDPYLGSYSDDC